MTLHKEIFAPAEPEEAEKVFALLKERVEWMNQTGIRHWNVYGYLDIFPLPYYRDLQKKGLLHVLKENGRILAAAVLLEEDEGWPEEGNSEALYVHSLVSGTAFRGAGERILRCAEKKAKERGKRFVRLDCDCNNKALNSWYEGQGYRMKGTCTDGPYTGNRLEKCVDQPM